MTDPGATPREARGALRAAPVLVVAWFALLATGYAMVVPVFSAPDEPFHFDYVRYLAREGALPDPTDASRPVASEAMGPPLYYGVLALGLRGLDPQRGAGLVIHSHAEIEGFVRAPERGLPDRLRPPLNPRYAKWRQGDEPNMYLRMAEDRFPWAAGPIRAVHWLRLVSVLCGVGSVWLVHRMARRVWPDRSDLPLLATSLVAFDPQFAFLAGTINNDNGVILLSTAALLVATRLLVDVRRPARDEWLFGSLIGFALIVKTNAAFLVPVAAGVILWRARGASGAREAVRSAVRVGVPVLALSGWFFVRGVWLYGATDPLGYALRAAQHPDLVLPPAMRAAFFGEVFGPRLFQSWWGLFDWVSLPMPEPLYLFYGGLSALAVAGAVVRFGSDAADRERACTLLYLAAFGLALCALVFLNWTFHSAQARLLFPTIGGVAIVLAGGLDTALAAGIRDRTRRRVVLALCAVLGLLSTGVLLGVVLPAYP